MRSPRKLKREAELLIFSVAVHLMRRMPLPVYRTSRVWQVMPRFR